jgi:hypothetical protein
MAAVSIPRLEGWQPAVRSLHANLSTELLHFSHLIYLNIFLSNTRFWGLATVPNKNHFPGKNFRNKRGRMKNIKRLVLLFGVISTLPVVSSSAQSADADIAVAKVLTVPGLVSFWDFSEAGGQSRVGLDENAYRLVEVGGKISRIVDKNSPFGHAAVLNGSQFFKAIDLASTPKLNINGPGAASSLTVVGWVKWTDRLSFPGAFIAGRWNESGTRQYALFIDLPYYAGKNRVVGHVSLTGRDSTHASYPELVLEGYDEPFSWDYSASASVVPENKWVMVAFTYDGSYVKSYLNGVFEYYGPQNYNYKFNATDTTSVVRQTAVKNPYYFPYGLGDIEELFCVGGHYANVTRSGGGAHNLVGRLGGVAVFNRALSAQELADLAALIPTPIIETPSAVSLSKSSPSYTQDFDTLAEVDSGEWLNGASYKGWYANLNGQSVNDYTAANGSS